MAHDVRYPPGWVLKGLYVIASRCLDRLSTFGSVFVNKKKKSHKWTAHDVRYPPRRGLKVGTCYRDPMPKSTFNIWFSFSEQKKCSHTSGRLMM